MNILEVYEKYKIMPQLAEHQLRVAAVGRMICDSFNGDLDSKNIVAACLLHDMGNIIKFDLQATRNLLNADMDITYWQKVRDEYKAKYGNDEHLAHLQISRELGVSDRVLELIDSVSFLGAPANAAGADFGKKIVGYCDERVAPLGVVSLEQRLADLRVRYRHHKDNTEARDNFENAMRQIERQIFERCSIKPEDITELSVAGTKKQLESFEI